MARVFARAWTGICENGVRFRSRLSVVNELKKREQSVEEIVARVRNRDGLCSYTPNIEYLVGGGSGGSQSWLDISDKTELILKSRHPVRYLVQREIQELDSQRSSTFDLKYLDWVMLFGRSLLSPSQSAKLSQSLALKDRYDSQLHNISRASECGMFSAAVHQTVLNLPPLPDPVDGLTAELNLGNKYAVLVGDFFAIKTIFFAEKVKNSQIFLKIIHGVEDFTYSSFSSFINRGLSGTIIANEHAEVEDWMSHAVGSSGYFTGGLNAVHTLNQSLDQGRKIAEKDLVNFVSRLATFLKVRSELEDMRRTEDDGADSGLVMKNPFIFTSLPAVIYQRSNPKVFQELRKTKIHVPNDQLIEAVRRDILESKAIPEAGDYLRDFGSKASKSLDLIGKDEFYVEAIQELLSAYST